PFSFTSSTSSRPAIRHCSTPLMGAPSPVSTEPRRFFTPATQSSSTPSPPCASAFSTAWLTLTSPSSSSLLAACSSISNSTRPEPSFPEPSELCWYSSPSSRSICCPSTTSRPCSSLPPSSSWFSKPNSRATAFWLPPESSPSSSEPLPSWRAPFPSFAFTSPPPSPAASPSAESPPSSPGSPSARNGTKPLAVLRYWSSGFPRPPPHLISSALTRASTIQSRLVRLASDMTPGWIVIAVIVLYLLNSIKILREYERGVIFRLGRALPQPKGPGIIFVFRPID